MVDAFIFTVDDTQAGERIDKFLCANITTLTRSAVQKVIDAGTVTVGGRSFVCTKLPAYMQGILDQGGLIASLDKEE